VCGHGFALLRHDAASFLDRAERWLLEAEAEHGLLLGIAAELRAGNSVYDDYYLATVEAEEEVVGCVFRTPPFKLGLTRMPIEALPAVVEDVAGRFGGLPAVLGPEAEASRFAELWAERFGVGTREGMRQRISVLEEVEAPPRPASGSMRLARPDDTERAVRWLREFEQEVGIGAADPEAQVASYLRDGELFLWQDGDVVSMAAATGATPHGIRIAYVYTPPELRGRGYASALVASLSQSQLDAGRRFCFLFTDRANPTSNEIYRRIGYRPVCDVVDVEFV
jgi:ribosomal protein S18 acetylase RimI-like enzyme